MAKPIGELYKLSMTLGNFPDACKIAKVKLLFKRGSKDGPIKLQIKISTSFYSRFKFDVTGVFDKKITCSETTTICLVNNNNNNFLYGNVSITVVRTYTEAVLNNSL